MHIAKTEYRINEKGELIEQPKPELNHSIQVQAATPKQPEKLYDLLRIIELGNSYYRNGDIKMALGQMDKAETILKELRRGFE